MMHRRSITARKEIEGVLKNNGWEFQDGCWRQWRLLERLPAFTEPSHDYTLEDARNDFPRADHPVVEYFKHLAERHAGEVALVWEGWDWFGEGPSAVGDDPLPRDARLWHPQFARKREQRKRLSQLRQDQNGQIPQGVDLREQVGDTTIVGWRAGSDGH